MSCNRKTPLARRPGILANSITQCIQQQKTLWKNQLYDPAILAKSINGSTPAIPEKKPRASSYLLAWAQHTETNQNTKVRAQHTDTSKNTKAWAQHIDHNRTL